MSENKKNANLGEPISVEQLNTVAGGYGEFASDSTRDVYCWFAPADGVPREDGRMKCKVECKGKFGKNDSDPVIPLYAGYWLNCYCFGNDECIDKWHKPCERPNRWYGPRV